MSTDAEGASEGKAKPEPWNSLEVAKLVAAMATPVALFFLGVYVTYQTEQSKREYQDAVRIADNEREKRTTEEARGYEARRQAADIERNKQIREENARREATFREQAFAREKAFRAESARRDLQMRQSADARDASVRREAVELARYSHLLSKRIELWDRIGPAVSAMRLEVARTNMGIPYTQETVRKSIAEIQDLSSIYSPYFSLDFWRGADKVLIGTQRFESIYRSYVNERKVNAKGIPILEGSLRTAWDEVNTAYGEFLVLARRELVVLDTHDPIRP